TNSRNSVPSVIRSEVHRRTIGRQAVSGRSLFLFCFPARNIEDLELPFPTPRDLVAALQRGDRQAREELKHRYRDEIRRVVLVFIQRFAIRKDVDRMTTRTLD